MTRVKSITDNLTIPVGFHPAIHAEISLPVREVVEIPQDALDAVLALGGICVLPEPEPEAPTEAPTTYAHIVTPVASPSEDED